MGKLNKRITRNLGHKKRTPVANKFHCEPIVENEQTSSSSCILVADKVPLEINNDQPNTQTQQCEKNGERTEQEQNEHKNKCADNVETNQHVDKSNNKKGRFLKKLAEERKTKGIILLPAKVETKIYKLKKALRKKGIDDNEIRDIIRKKRREEELKFRKDLKHLCFKCRQPGHTLANCTQMQSTDASVEVCYFCGSGEHRLSECIKYKAVNKDKTKLPYAKCFLCKQTGHLTRTCKLNTKGIFPKGGKCLLCGSVNHLVKDCDKNENKHTEQEVLLHTYGQVADSVDVDDFQMDIPTIRSKAGKKGVKF